MARYCLDNASGHVYKETANDCASDRDPGFRSEPDQSQQLTQVIHFPLFRFYIVSRNLDTITMETGEVRRIILLTIMLTLK